MSSSALKLANYRAKAHEVFEGLPSLEDLSGLHSYDYDTDATEAKAAEVNNLRNEVYQEMSMIYGNVDWEPLRDKQRRQTSA